MNKACLLLVLLFFLPRPQYSLAQEKLKCQLMDSSGLKSWLRENSQIQKVVFFASWCGACESSLQKVSESDVLVGVHDSLDRVEEVYQKFGNPEAPCFLDKEYSIANDFDIKDVPFTLDAVVVRR